MILEAQRHDRRASSFTAIVTTLSEGPTVKIGRTSASGVQVSSCREFVAGLQGMSGSCWIPPLRFATLWSGRGLLALVAVVMMG